MAVRHLRLVCAYVVAGIVGASLLLSQQKQPHAHSPLHQPHLSPTDAAAARFVLLNAVLAISAASLLFCSTAFALAGLVLVAQPQKNARDGLHYSDAPPADDAARERRQTAVHTLIAANVAVCALWVAFCWSLGSLRWALPPLPAWVTTCCAVLCAINLLTGAVLAAKHSRYAPWLLPTHSSMPLNEPCRLVAMFEQLRTKAFGRRPGLPKAQRCSGKRVRRSKSWEHSPSPPHDQLQHSPLLSQAPGLLQVVVDGQQGSSPPSVGCSAPSGDSSPSAAAWAALDDSSFHTPPRAISRTYSEDEEVDLSSCSVSSTISSQDPECGRLFMDVLQANILSHPDDTLQFLAKLSPERTPQSVTPQLPRLSLPAFPCSAKPATAFATAVDSPLTPCPPLTPSPAAQKQMPEVSPMPQLSPLAITPACGFSPVSPSGMPPLSGASFAERKQSMTRVSATVDELLGAIVGELV